MNDAEFWARLHRLARDLGPDNIDRPWAGSRDDLVVLLRNCRWLSTVPAKNPRQVAVQLLAQAEFRDLANSLWRTILMYAREDGVLASPWVPGRWVSPPSVRALSAAALMEVPVVSLAVFWNSDLWFLAAGLAVALLPQAIWRIRHDRSTSLTA